MSERGRGGNRRKEEEEEGPKELKDDPAVLRARTRGNTRGGGIVGLSSKRKGGEGRREEVGGQLSTSSKASRQLIAEGAGRRHFVAEKIFLSNCL